MVCCVDTGNVFFNPVHFMFILLWFFSLFDGVCQNAKIYEEYYTKKKQMNEYNVRFTWDSVSDIRAYHVKLSVSSNNRERKKNHRLKTTVYEII